MLVNSIFSFFHNVFYPFQNKFLTLSHIYFVVCKCFQFGQGQNFVVWWRVKAPFTTLIAFVARVNQYKAAQEPAAWSLTYTVHIGETLWTKAAMKLQLFGLYY